MISGPRGMTWIMVAMFCLNTAKFWAERVSLGSSFQSATVRGKNEKLVPLGHGIYSLEMNTISIVSYELTNGMSTRPCEILYSIHSLLSALRWLRSLQPMSWIMALGTCCGTCLWPTSLPVFAPSPRVWEWVFKMAAPYLGTCWVIFFYAAIGFGWV